ncbi:MAG TPA: type II CAAX endopeptidase family protein [Chloroflexota bacterium]
MSGERALNELRGLLVYLGGAFGIAWLCWLPLVLGARQDGNAFWAALSVLGSFAPLVAAECATRRWPVETDRATPLAKLARWRVGLLWCAIVLLGAAPIPLTALAIDRLLGGAPATWASAGEWLQLPRLLVTAVLFGPLGEEPGWRGYLLPLLERHVGLLRASLVVGVIWAAWHLPLFLVQNTIQYATPALTYLAWVAGLSVLFAWVYAQSGRSVLLTVLLHAAVNTWWWVLPVLPQASGSERPFVLSVVLTCLLAAAVAPAVRSIGR